MVQFGLHSVLVPYIFRVPQVTYGAHFHLLVPCGCFRSEAALVVSQWQHRVWAVQLHPPIKGDHKAGQAASIVFQVFGVAW